jgi:hypothetical protein
MAKGIYVSKLVFLVGVSIAFSIVLLIGLLAGLLSRPTKCKLSSDSLVLSSSISPISQTTSPSTSSTSTTSRLVETSTNIEFDGIRLPKNIKPTNYNLNIKAFFKPTQLLSEANADERFEGTISIDFIVTKPTNLIKLHCDLSIKILDSIQLTSNGQVTKVRLDQTDYSDNQIFEIVLDNQLVLGNYSLKLDYQSNFGGSSNIVGFYKTSYVEDGLVK